MSASISTCPTLPPPRRRVLDVLATAQKRLTVQQLVRRARAGRGTVHEVVTILRGRGLAVRSGRPSAWALVGDLEQAIAILAPARAQPTSGGDVP